MGDKSLETWKMRLEAICSGPSPDEVVRMRWGNEWRYYQYQAYTHKNGQMWRRVTKKHYDDFVEHNKNRKHLTLNDLINNT